MKTQKKLRIFTFLLAGGEGTRLWPLTMRRAKSAVPFGGMWTIIDFVMWCLYYSGLHDVGVLVQRNAVSLIDHLLEVWPRKPGGGSYFQILPSEGKEKFLHTANAAFQHIQRTKGYGRVLVVGGDHLYKVNFSQFVDFHQEHNADVSIMAITTSVKEARELGVIGTDPDYRVRRFREKPEYPEEIDDQPDRAFCSMGVYLFEQTVLEKYLREDAEDEKSEHDFGRNIIPKMIAGGLMVYAFPFSDSTVPGQKRPYWRDLGTLDTYWREHMKWCSDEPPLNLFSEEWVIPAVHVLAPMLKLSNHPRCDHVQADNGCIIDNCDVSYSSLGKKCIVKAGCEISESVLMPQIIVEEDCILRKAIVDVDPLLRSNQRVVIPAGTQIGVDHELDDKRDFTITESGITVVPCDWFEKEGRTITVE